MVELGIDPKLLQGFKDEPILLGQRARQLFFREQPLLYQQISEGRLIRAHPSQGFLHGFSREESLRDQDVAQSFAGGGA